MFDEDTKAAIAEVAKDNFTMTWREAEVALKVAVKAERTRVVSFLKNNTGVLNRETLHAFADAIERGEHIEGRDPIG